MTFPTVPRVDLQKFMGTWYVAAGRFTIFEKEVHNGVEVYSYDESSKKIDIQFTYNKGSLKGELKKFSQTGKVVEGTNNAHWHVSPFWPLSFDYLIIALAEDYSWVAVGVPSQKYLWIMFRNKSIQKNEVQNVIEELRKINYNTSDIVFVPHG